MACPEIFNGIGDIIINNTFKLRYTKNTNNEIKGFIGQ